MLIGNALSAEHQWFRLLRQILETPFVIPERKAVVLGQSHRAVKEVIGSYCKVDMQYPLVTNKQRKLKYKFSAAEAYWILCGSNRLEEIETWCPQMRQFSDDGVTLAGAYGPPIIDQLPYIISLLSKEPTSRQAVMTTWNRNPAPSKDIPCTVSTQFLIRKNRLHLVHNMRSSDIWLGWPYDIFNFSCIALYVAAALNNFGMELELGELTFMAGSQHLYMSNFEKAIEVKEGPQLNAAHKLSAEYMTPDMVMSWLYRRATDKIEANDQLCNVI